MTECDEPNNHFFEINEFCRIETPWDESTPSHTITQDTLAEERKRKKQTSTRQGLHEHSEVVYPIIMIWLYFRIKIKMIQM